MINIRKNIRAVILDIGEDMCDDVLHVIESILAHIFDFMENTDPGIVCILKIVHANYIRHW
jgi:hypothetical protein